MMTKHSNLIILCVLIMTSFSVCQAQTKSHIWESPQSVFTLDDGTELTKVEFSNSATLVSFRRTSPWGNDTLRVHSTSCIIDEQGERHYALESEGIPMDEYVRWGFRKEWCYTLKFDPLPQDTKSIDVLIGPYNGNAAWYGVHEKGTELDLSAPENTVSQEELREELMKKGRATVRGHVTNGNDYPVWPVWVLHMWDDLDKDFAYGTRKAVQIHENGDFEFSVDLQRPAFASLYLGYQTQLKPILLYLEPGKTVTLDVRDVYGKGAYVGYSSNQRFRKLLECYPARLLDIPIPESTEYIDGTQKLNNYLVHKYGLSPMEARILRGFHDMRQRILALQVLAIHTYEHEGVDIEALKRRLFEEDTTVDKQQEEAINRADDLIDKQKTDLTNKMDRNDVSWVLSPFFASVGEEIRPNLNPHNTMHCMSVEDMKSYVSETDAILHEYFGTTESPFLLQELSLQNLSLWLNNLTPLQGQDREEVISYLEQHYTDPYVRGRVRGVVAEIDSLDYFGETFPVEKTGCNSGVLERIYAPFKGKFLQIITLRDGENEHILPTIGNLLTQYAKSPDVAFLFVAHGNEIADEDCMNTILNFYPYNQNRLTHEFLKDGYIHLSDDEYREIAVAVNSITGDFDYVTLNREGQPLRRPFSMSSESAFNYSLNQQLYGVYDDVPSDESTNQRNGVEILESEWNTLKALNYSLSKGTNLRPDVFVEDYGSPLIPNNYNQKARRYVYLTQNDKSLPLEFEITKHLKLAGKGTYRVDLLYSIDGDNLTGTFDGKTFSLNTAECNAALKKLTRQEASEIPVLRSVASGTKDTWTQFKLQTDYWGWNYANFLVEKENGTDTIDCTFKQDSKAVRKLGDKAIKWFCIIDLRITKIK